MEDPPHIVALGAQIGESGVRKDYLEEEKASIKNEIAVIEARTRQIKADEAEIKQEEAGLDARIARLQQEEARLAAQQQARQRQDPVRREDKYPLEKLVEDLLAAPTITGAEALAPITEPPTLEAALKLCDDAKRVQAGVAYKFRVLAKKGKAYFLEKIEKLRRLDVPVTIDLLIETARKERSEGGIGNSHEQRMVDFALYVDYVVEKYGFTWDGIRFSNWYSFQNETCTLLQGRLPPNLRLKVGLQFLKNEGIEVQGNPKADIINKQQNKTRLHEAMIEARRRSAEGPAGAPL